MKTIGQILTVSALVVVVLGFSDVYVQSANNGNDNKIDVLDDCLPGDPGWTPTGGCALKKNEGDVPEAEFGALLVSPLTVPPNGFLIGHPSWRNEPSHLTAKEGKKIRITNKGGRGHTFTEVADFGGGFIAGLNIGLTAAPECQPGLVLRLNPGDSTEIVPIVTNDPLHKFQCCIHPWMRATIRVE